MGVKVFYFAWGLLLATASFAVPPPETFDLIPFSGQNPIDKKLESWLQSHQKDPHWLSLSKNNFDAFASKLDPMVRDVLALKRAERHRKSMETVVSRMLKEYDGQKQRYLHHPLFPYYIEGLLQSKRLSSIDRKRLEKDLKNHGAGSCPQKDLLLDEINELEKIGNQRMARQILRTIKKFRGERFLKETLDSYLEVLDESQRGPLKAELSALVEHFPQVKEDHDWLISSKAPTSQKSRFENQLENVSKSARKRRCNAAKRLLLKTIKLDKKGQYFADASEAAEKVGACYRRKGPLSRIRYWKSVTKTFAKSYGFQGRAFTRGKEGAIQWGRDKFEVAKSIYKSIYRSAQRHKDLEVEAKALHTLGRIAENEGKFHGAIRFLEAFVAKFPGHDEFNNALRALVLLGSTLNKPDTARKYVERLVAEESKKKLDDRSSYFMSFGLFWLGRLQFEGGQQSAAEESWRRGASEYYSTFYGALAHYLLEKTKKKSYLLQPVRTRSFEFKNLILGFDAHEKTVVHRASRLLQLGLEGDASCELRELRPEESEKEKLFVKSLFLHTAGDWLDSIKIFSSLPRTFRHTLPIGSERLLFPRAYIAPVKKFAKKLKLDSDLIYAIIRQESAFNTKAISPVGARGLMQLMPATARLEARKLGIGYVSKAQRRHFIRQARHRNRLLNAETNLTIGVHHVQSLLKRYKHPVFVLTSYNASPRVTARWIKNLSTENMLAFIERIPYKETKGYVQLVLRNYFYYKRWYGSQNADMPYLDAILPEALSNIGGQAAAKKGPKKI